MTKALTTVPQEPRIFARDDGLWTSSLDVAASFKKDHRAVLRDIRCLDCSPEFRQANFKDVQVLQSTTVVDRYQPTVEMTKDGFVFLAMGYRGARVAAFKEAYIARFNAMEAELRSLRARPMAIDLNDPTQLLQVTHQALTMLSQAKEQLQVAHAKIEADAPAVAYYQNFMDATGLFNLQNAGRALQEKPNKFIEWLKKEGYIFYQGGALVPKSSYRERGWFEVKALTVGETNRMQTFVTGRGLEKLSLKLGKPIDLFGHVGSALSH